MSQTTERAIAAALKKLLQQKTLNKITISDLANECGINRMTFYYHFKDIYDLIEWMTNERAEKALEGNKNIGSWQQGLQNLLDAL
ncbi:MAG: TetR family transcriptional regulator, partial [Clostridia bacterium]|nr:TetR family transcriptional regulator [Clostridia bacterium]